MQVIFSKTIFEEKKYDLFLRSTESEAGHMLACMVELKGKVKSLQCGQFLSQVAWQSFFLQIYLDC